MSHDCNDMICKNLFVLIMFGLNLNIFICICNLIFYGKNKASQIKYDLMTWINDDSVSALGNSAHNVPCIIIVLGVDYVV